jgi:hypothetical protein
MQRFGYRFNDRALLPWEDLVAAFRIFVLDLCDPHAMGLRHVVYLRDPPVLATVVAVISIVAVALAATVTRAAPLSLSARSCATFSATHIVVTLLAWAVGNNDPLVSRYLAPAWPPLLVVLLDLVRTVRLPANVAPLAAFGWILGVNVPKSAAILSPDPPGDLVERHRATASGDTWRSAVPWDPRDLR